VHDRADARAAVLKIAPPADLPQQVERALAEDIGSGDVTAALIPGDRQGLASVSTRERTVRCGRPYVDAVFAQLDRAVHVGWFVDEGAWAEANQTLFTISGPARVLLIGERTALNFVQLLSATASVARRYATLIEGTRCTVLDTRKTIPGLRTAQKYAVRVGGARNHRIGLYDGILIKENHIAAAGSIAAAVAAARRLQPKMPVEVEVEDLAELQEAIDARADIALLDNFSLALMQEGVAANRAAQHPIKLEASGGVSEESVREIALTGVDFVSVGAITKNVRAIDLSMRFG
jgi:nicotinate-nucleotide pyrophosphorylase (carboxylating)